MITSSIVLYKNSLEECHTILDCLLAAPVEKIYLVDHSGDDRLSVLKEYSTRVEYIPHENLGYGSGHNVAFKKVYCVNPNGFHIVLNTDIVFEKDSIDTLLSFMVANPSIGCCMPRILNTNKTDQRLCKYLPTPLDLFFRRFFPKFISRKFSNQLCMRECNFQQILSVPWLSGAFMFLRVSAIKAVNGFDERFFLYAEDIDFSRRIHQHFETVYYPHCSIIHAHQAASYHSLRMTLLHIHSVIQYFNKWGWVFDKERKMINERSRQKNLSGSICQLCKDNTETTNAGKSTATN